MEEGETPLKACWWKVFRPAAEAMEPLREAAEGAGDMGILALWGLWLVEEDMG